MLKASYVGEPAGIWNSKVHFRKQVIVFLKWVDSAFWV